MVASPGDGERGGNVGDALWWMLHPFTVARSKVATAMRKLGLGKLPRSENRAGALQIPRGLPGLAWAWASFREAAGNDHHVLSPLLELDPNPLSGCESGARVPTKNLFQ